MRTHIAGWKKAAFPHIRNALSVKALTNAKAGTGQDVLLKAKRSRAAMATQNLLPPRGIQASATPVEFRELPWREYNQASYDDVPRWAPRSSMLFACGISTLMWLALGWFIASHW